MATGLRKGKNEFKPEKDELPKIHYMGSTPMTKTGYKIKWQNSSILSGFVFILKTDTKKETGKICKSWKTIDLNLDAGMGKVL